MVLPVWEIFEEIVVFAGCFFQWVVRGADDGFGAAKEETAVAEESPNEFDV